MGGEEALVHRCLATVVPVEDVDDEPHMLSAGSSGCLDVMSVGGRHPGEDLEVQPVEIHTMGHDRGTHDAADTLCSTCSWIGCLDLCDDRGELAQ